MVKRLRFKSVKTRLVFLFALVALVPLLIASIIVYRQRVESIKSHAFTKLTAIRDLKVEQLNIWLSERMGDVRTISEDYEIRAVAGAYYNQNPPNKESVKESRELLARYLRNYNSFYEIFIMDAASGDIIVSSNPSMEGDNRSRDDYFTGAMRTKQIYIKDIYYSKTQNMPAMAFSCPVFPVTDTGGIVGVAVARINLHRSLYALLLQRTGLGETGETLIVNSEVKALNELKWYKDAPLKLTIRSKPTVTASRGGTGIMEADDYRNVKVLAAFTHIPETGWGFVAKQDQVEVYAPIDRLLKNLLVITAACIAIIILVAVFTANAISHPVLEMTAAARKIREGDLSARNNTRRIDEFGFLGQVIDEMTDSVQSQIEVQQMTSEIIAVMVDSKTPDDFSRNILEKLLEVTGSNCGVFFIHEKENNRFRRLFSIGMDIDLLDSLEFRAGVIEGEMGAALVTRKISHTRDIPGDTVFKLKTFMGTAVPGETLTIPIIVDDAAAAVIFLATLDKYTEDNLKILNNTLLSLNTAFSNILGHINTAKMAEHLKEKNQEITIINDELKHQAEELNAQRGQLAEADRLKSEFLSNMSHELRTPLNSILALSQLMIAKGTGKNPGKEAENLEIIERNGRILLGLINDILDLSKIESGRVELNRTRFTPGEVVGMSLESITQMAESKGLRLQSSITENPAIYSDIGRVRQILSNLLSNAVKFTDKGKVSVSVTASGDTVSFAVSDTGIGIDAGDLPYIFDEFRQVDGSSTRPFEGTGLGLTISQKFARLLGGRILARSEPGKGSTFTLELPVRHDEEVEPEAKPAAKQTPDVPGVVPGPAPRVLVIEDNEVATMQIRSALEENGFEVSTAADGREGLDIINKTLPDAVILDLMMPHIDGFEVLSQIRSNPGTAGVPVLVLTAKELTGDEMSRLKRDNIRRLIRKGNLDRGRLAAAVKNMLNAPPPAPRAQESAQPSPPADCGTILVVEDYTDNLFIVTSILDEEGYPYVTAETGEEAIKKVEESVPGLILMDIQLPLMSGMEAMRRIRTFPGTENLPVIALTARAMEGDKEELISQGFDDYIAKPIDPYRLLDTIRKWLGGKE